MQEKNKTLTFFKITSACRQIQLKQNGCNAQYSKWLLGCCRGTCRVFDCRVMSIMRTGGCDIRWLAQVGAQWGQLCGWRGRAESEMLADVSGQINQVNEMTLHLNVANWYSMKLYWYSMDSIKNRHNNDWIVVLPAQATVQALIKVRKKTLAEAVREADQGQFEDRWVTNCDILNKNNVLNNKIYENILIFPKKRVTANLLFWSEAEEFSTALWNENGEARTSPVTPLNLIHGQKFTWIKWSQISRCVWMNL